MAGYIGKIEPFDDALETWASYAERLEQCFALNDIEGENASTINTPWKENVQPV